MVPDNYTTELDQARASFRDAVWTRLAVENEGGKRPGVFPLKRVAEQVEAATHAWAMGQPGGSGDKQYTAKMRSLCFNLKKNAALRGQVRSGEVGASELAAMDKDQLADPTVIEGRAKMERKLAEEVGSSGRERSPQQRRLDAGTMAARSQLLFADWLHRLVLLRPGRIGLPLASGRGSEKTRFV